MDSPGYDDEDLEHDPALAEAMEMNRMLKEALEKAEAGEDPSAVLGLGGGAGGRPAYGGRPKPHGARSRGGSGSSRRTVKMPSIAPPPGGAKRTARDNLTFDNVRLEEIGKGNQRLLKNLFKISGGSGTIPKATASRPTHKSSAAINRSRRNRALEADNAAFLRRLKGVKPTMPRASHAKAAESQKRYAELRTTMAPGTKPRTRKPKAKEKRAPAPRPEWVD